MSTPEQTAAPYRPSTAATLGAAGQSSVAATHAAVTPTLVATGVQARAVAGAAAQIVEALRSFARTRSSTIIPMLQRDLVETFVQRTPDEIARMLGKELVRERVFLRRQAMRITRDLPKVLSEADIDARRVAMKKLMAREQRYMAQREKAMFARAHAVVESLDTQEASPEGAYWVLGHSASGHTPGCLAMANRFWPWPVLREVIIPPVHPGCPCELITLQEAIAKGLMKADAPLPTTADAMIRARKAMALEEAIYELLPWDEVVEALLEEHLGLEEAQKRYPKGALHGGEFMPKVGADMARAKGALKKLFPGGGGTQRGADRHVWLKGHHTLIPHDKKFDRQIGAGASFTSPAGSTNVYRNGELVSVPGEPPRHPDLQPPKGADKPSKLTTPAGMPDAGAAIASEDRQKLVAQISKRLEQPKQGPPVSVGQDGKAVHDALLASGFVVRPGSAAPKGELRVHYINKAGHQLSVQYSRKSGKTADVSWKPDLHSGGLYDNEWAAFKAGKEPAGFSLPSTASWKGKIPGSSSGSKAKSSEKSSFGGGWKGTSSGYLSDWKPKPPPPPVVHAALHDSPAAAGLIPNFDHVEFTTAPGSARATGPDGAKYALKTHGGNQDHVASELLANALYRKLGASVPAAGVRHIDDQTPDFASIPDAKLKEPPIDRKPGQRVSSGIILRDAAGNVTIFEPKNHFGGYEHTFPKGGVEDGLTPQQNAHKELWEETGLHAKITGIVGDYQGDTSVSRYYTGVLTGGTPTAGDETAAVKTVSPAEAAKLLNKERDQAILADVLRHPLPKGKAPADNFPGPVGLAPAVAHPLSAGKSESIKTPSAELGKHFMADALLGNWDFVGRSDGNVLWDGGKPTRVDQSSALGYRSSGEHKPFGPVPTEVWSMLGPKGQGFGKVAVTDAQKRKQAAAIEKTLTPAAIDELVAAAPFKTAAIRDKTAAALKQRVAWMGRYAKGAEHEPEPLTGNDAAVELAASQAGLAMFPEQENALHLYGAEGAAVNAHLESGASAHQASADQRMVIKELDSLLRHTATQDDVTAFAGIDPAALGPVSDLVGKTMSHKGYLNLNLDEQATRAGAQGVLEVLVPSGVSALYTRGIPDVPVGDSQPDLIAARGSRLRIVRTTKKGGKVHVQVVMLP